MSDVLMKPFPLAKYKGQPTAAIMNDPEYCEWLSSQDWFRERYGDIYQVIINNFQEPNETPEHNAMQALCLDPVFVQKLACIAYAKKTDTVAGSYDSRFEFAGWDFKANIEFDESEENYFRRLKRAVDECSWLKKEGFDTLDKIKEKFPQWRGYEQVLFVEFKTSLGDDYPAVLRQVKANQRTARLECASYERSYLVVVERFSAKGATFAQVRQIFANDGIGLTHLNTVKAVDLEQEKAKRAQAEVDWSKF